MSGSNVASVINYFANANEGFTTTLGSTITAGASTVPLASTTGLTNGTIFVGIIEPGATNQQVFTGTVDTGGGQVTGVIWTRGTNVGHAGGVAIVDYTTGTAFNMLSAGILKQHTQAGAHTGLTTDTLVTSGNATIGGVGAVTGNATVGGTLGVTGATTLTGAVGGAGYSTKTLAIPYKFSVYRNAAWTDGTTSFSLVGFDTKVFDTGTNIDIVTNKGRFTAPISGFYFFSWAIGKSVTSNNAALSAIYKNGSELARNGSQSYQGATTGGFSSTGSILLQAAANDYFEIFSYGSGGAGSTGFNNTNFQGFLVSAT